MIAAQVARPQVIRSIHKPVKPIQFGEQNVKTTEIRGGNSHKILAQRNYYLGSEVQEQQRDVLKKSHNSFLSENEYGTTQIIAKMQNKKQQVGRLRMQLHLA